MRSDAQANREAIVTAARHLIAARGPDVPLVAVASHAGVGIATLYRHFPERRDLVVGIAQDLGVRMLAAVDHYRPLIEQDAEQHWRGFVRALADLRIGALLPDLVRTLGDDAPPVEIEAVRTDGLAAIDGVLSRAKAAGLVRDDVTAERFQLGLATVTRPLPRQLSLDLTDHTRWLVDVFLAGLRP